MSCYHPVACWQHKKSGAMVFDEPRLVDQWAYKKGQVPCWKCVGCRGSQGAMWGLRFMHEAQLHERNCVLTLTYSPEHLPPGGRLDYPAVQRFIKRLRKQFPRQPGDGIRVATCGEYGDQLGRPHYHMALMNFDFDDKQGFGKSKSGTRLWTSQTLERLWPFGHATVGVLDFASACYIGRYCTKKVTGPLAKEHYSRVDLETGEVYELPREFLHVSTRPGIGRDWFEKHQADVFPHDYAVTRDGFKARVPRYYDRLLKARDLAMYEAIKAKRVEDAQLRAADNTPARLAVRETVEKARLSFKARR